MRKIFLFMMVTLDGFFEGPDHDLSWHVVDAEFNDFAQAQMREADTILFGRRTYQLMESFWPSPEGLIADPVVAE
jgi:dihydrofolate reductase